MTSLFCTPTKTIIPATLGLLIPFLHCAASLKKSNLRNFVNVQYEKKKKLLPKIGLLVQIGGET